MPSPYVVENKRSFVGARHASPVFRPRLGIFSRPLTVAAQEFGNFSVAGPQDITAVARETNDADLVSRMRDGDERAFNVIYERTNRPVFRFLLSMSADRAVAEETLQETFLELIRRPEGYDPSRGQLRPYLLGVARNKLRRHFASARRVEEIPENSAAQTPDPFEDLDRAERVAALRQAIGSLPEAYRETIVLCDLEELSYEEAAAVLGIVVGTVRSRLHRGRALLVKKLAAEHGAMQESA